MESLIVKELIDSHKFIVQGKTALITGCSSGIGLEIACVLSSVGAIVIVACDNQKECDDTIAYIKKHVPEANLVSLLLDLSSLASIKTFVASFISLGLGLHLLIHNASVLSCAKSYTVDSLETTFAINYLGHFYLTLLLLDRMTQSASARIVILSSSANKMLLPPSGIDFSNLNAEKGYSPSIAYGQSKLASILFAKELQRRVDVEGIDITVTSMHAGSASYPELPSSAKLCNMLDFLCSSNHKSTIFDLFNSKKDRDEGLATAIYCAVSPGVQKGEFYCQSKINTNLLHDQAHNQTIAKELWETSQNLINARINRY